MDNRRRLESVLAYLEQDLEGFIGAAFVPMDRGEPLAAHSVRPDFDQSAVVGLGRSLFAEALRSLSPEADSGEVENIVVCTAAGIHVFYVVSESLLLCLVVDRGRTNLALVNASLRLRTSGLGAAKASQHDASVASVG